MLKLLTDELTHLETAIRLTQFDLAQSHSEAKSASLARSLEVYQMRLNLVRFKLEQIR